MDLNCIRKIIKLLKINLLRLLQHQITLGHISKTRFQPSQTSHHSDLLSLSTTLIRTNKIRNKGKSVQWDKILKLQN